MFPRVCVCLYNKWATITNSITCTWSATISTNGAIVAQMSLFSQDCDSTVVNLTHTQKFQINWCYCRFRPVSAVQQWPCWGAEIYLIRNMPPVFVLSVMTTLTLWCDVPKSFEEVVGTWTGITPKLSSSGGSGVLLPPAGWDGEQSGRSKVGGKTPSSNSPSIAWYPQRRWGHSCSLDPPLQHHKGYVCCHELHHRRQPEVCWDQE